MPPSPDCSVGKQLTSGTESRVSEDTFGMAQSVTNITPVTRTGRYRLGDTIKGEKVSLLLDTGVAVTLLRKDTWDCVTDNRPQKLTP